MSSINSETPERPGAGIHLISYHTINHLLLSPFFLFCFHVYCEKAVMNLVTYLSCISETPWLQVALYPVVKTETPCGTPLKKMRLNQKISGTPVIE